MERLKIRINFECTHADKKSRKQEKKIMPKDACYRKVKSRYKVFPSAYASGAIAKCRKVGASNWGNKKAKTKRRK